MAGVEPHKAVLPVLFHCCHAAWQQPSQKLSLPDPGSYEQSTTVQIELGCCRLSPLLTKPSITCNSKPSSQMGFDMYVCVCLI